MLSVSTTWNFERHGALAPAVSELQRMGFEGVELRARGAVPDLQAGGAHCRDIGMRCRSVHAPLIVGPWSEGDPSKDLASTDEGRRQRAVVAMLSTLTAAAAAGADVIVLHPGEVAVARGKERYKAALAAVVAGDPIPEDFETACAERSRLRDSHLEAAARSLFDLTRAEPNVTWAIETRLYMHEIPSLEEVDLLLSDTAGKNVAYWHDTGHAHLQGRMGLADPLAWLTRYGPRAAGIHLHDVVGDVDHLPPGPGEVDWAGVRAGVSAGMLRVLEVHGRHGGPELLAGAAHLRDVGLD